MECLNLNYIFKFFEDKAKLFYVRKILLVVPAAYIFFGLFYRTYPNINDPMGLTQRLIPSAIFLLVYLLSYLVDSVKNNIYKYFYYTIYFANFHLLYLSYINKLTLNYAFSIIIVIVLCNLLIKAQGELKRFHIVMLVAVTLTTIYTKNVEANKFVFLSAFYVISFASFFISKLSYLNIKNIKEKKLYYQTIFNKSPIGLLKCDKKGDILDINRHILKLSNKKDKNCFIGKNIFDVLNMEEFKLDNVEDDELLEGEVHLTWGEEFWVDYSIERIKSDQKDEFIIAFRDITNRKALEVKLTYLYVHDQMKGLYNYRYFKKELKRYDKSRKLPISIIMIDIDKVKEINDKNGHIFGNKIIRKTAEILDSVVRKEDVLARVGGDEFAVILPNTDSKTAAGVANRIYSKIENYNNKSQSKQDINLSIGWGTKDNKSDSLQDILKDADLKMYDAKNLGS